MSNDIEYPPNYRVTATIDDVTTVSIVPKSNMTSHLAHLGLDPHESRSHRFSKFVRDNGSGFVMTDRAYIAVSIER